MCLLGDFNNVQHELTSNALSLKCGENRQRKHDHVLAIDIMPDQLLQLFIANVIFIGRGAVQHADYVLIYFRDEKALRKGVDAQLNCFACRGFFRRKARKFHLKTFVNIRGKYLSNEDFIH